MNKKIIVVGIVAFLALIIGMFTFTYLKQSELKETPGDITGNDELQEVDPVDDAYSNITRVDATHFYIDGVHTLVGEILMPTPCDLLEADMVVRESYPEQITLELDVINTAEFCAQVMTPQRFMAEVSASPDATFDATFLGRRIDINIIPAPDGQTPDEFELFIKG